MPIQDLINDPVGFFRSLLIRLPAVLIALVLHECAHGYVAYKCGDPTAKMLGRLTLNPLKHLDPLGTAMMVLAGIGWAKPVPVNPLHFRHYRRDDLLVSIAGITMNLILCLVFTLFCQVFLTVLFHTTPSNDTYTLISEGVLNKDRYTYYAYSELYRYYFYVGEEVGAIWGDTLGILYEMLSRAVVVNLCLAVFNLLPVPPLDGYHVLNDLVLKKSLFADPRVTRVASMALFLIVMSTNWLDKLLSWVTVNGLGALGSLGYAAVSAVGAL